MQQPLASRFKVAAYQLASSALPPVTDTVLFAEQIRAHLMGIHKNIIGGDAGAVSRLFSGKSPTGGPAKGHVHIFVWPMDQDNDGRIDGLIVKAARAFNVSELAALDRLQTVRQLTSSPDIALTLVSLSKGMPATPTKQWISTTPFVTNRHHRKGRGTFSQWLAGEIRRECSIHNLPNPTNIEFLEHAVNGERPLQWTAFVRSRKGGPPLQGHGCRLTFAEAVEEPFALGALCHFGLGLFLPNGATQWNNSPPK